MRQDWRVGGREAEAGWMGGDAGAGPGGLDGGRWMEAGLEGG